ncbi:MAG TPA: sensor histidine kinase [Jatrophihabitantaceae bacterium]|nr:sensor histidine kinase [Jatrophihabitantaceae bacterium]
MTDDAIRPGDDDNGRMAARADQLLAFLGQRGPRSMPSGWALALDSAVAVALAAVAVSEVARHGAPDNTGVIATAALTALPLAARRLYPITVFLVIVAAIVATNGHYTPPIAFATAVFAAYSAMVHSRYRNLAVGVVLVVTLAVTATFADTLPSFPGRFTALFAIVPAMIAGLGIRELRLRLRDSATRLRRATEEHEAATRRAIEAERARIASELHDVVTHNVSVMVVQAGAARTVLASSPAEAEQALLAVEASGRTAMADLRNLLGLLSPSDDGVALRPQPGLGELDTLIGRVSAAGLPVQLHISGTPRPLAPGANLAAYRVIQEALTNVMRHAGQATTSVSLDWGDKLIIAVSDNGNGCGTGGVAPGRGLLGLQERVSLYGGQLDAGPQPGGGWQVRAVMPTGLVS